MLFGELIGHSLSNIEDKRTKDLVKLQIQQILFSYSHQEASRPPSFSHQPVSPVEIHSPLHFSTGNNQRQRPPYF